MGDLTFMEPPGSSNARFADWLNDEDRNNAIEKVKQFLLNSDDDDIPLHLFQQQQQAPNSAKNLSFAIGEDSNSNNNSNLIMNSDFNLNPNPTLNANLNLNLTVQQQQYQRSPPRVLVEPVIVQPVISGFGFDPSASNSSIMTSSSLMTSSSIRSEDFDFHNIMDFILCTKLTVLGDPVEAVLSDDKLKSDENSRQSFRSTNSDVLLSSNNNENNLPPDLQHVSKNMDKISTTTTIDSSLSTLIKTTLHPHPVKEEEFVEDLRKAARKFFTEGIEEEKILKEISKNDEKFPTIISAAKNERRVPIDPSASFFATLKSSSSCPSLLDEKNKSKTDKQRFPLPNRQDIVVPSSSSKNLHTIGDNANDNFVDLQGLGENVRSKNHLNATLSINSTDNTNSNNPFSAADLNMISLSHQDSALFLNTLNAENSAPVGASAPLDLSLTKNLNKTTSAAMIMMNILQQQQQQQRNESDDKQQNFDYKFAPDSELLMNLLEKVDPTYCFKCAKILMPRDTIVCRACQNCFHRNRCTSPFDRWRCEQCFLKNVPIKSLKSKPPAKTLQTSSKVGAKRTRDDDDSDYEPDVPKTKKSSISVKKLLAVSGKLRGRPPKFAQKPPSIKPPKPSNQQAVPTTSEVPADQCSTNISASGASSFQTLPSIPIVCSTMKTDQIRHSITTKLADCLRERIKGYNYIRMSDEDVDKIAARIESQMFTTANCDVIGSTYRTQLKFLVNTLKNKKNYQFFRKILTGEFRPPQKLLKETTMVIQDSPVPEHQTVSKEPRPVHFAQQKHQQPRSGSTDHAGYAQHSPFPNIISVSDLLDVKEPAKPAQQQQQQLTVPIAEPAVASQTADPRLFSPSQNAAANQQDPSSLQRPIDTKQEIVPDSTPPFVETAPNVSSIAPLVFTTATPPTTVVDSAPAFPASAPNFPTSAPSVSTSTAPNFPITAPKTVHKSRQSMIIDNKMAPKSTQAANQKMKNDIENRRNSLPSDITVPVKDTTSQHKSHLFDMNCEICAGKLPACPNQVKSSSQNIDAQQNREAAHMLGIPGMTSSAAALMHHPIHQQFRRPNPENLRLLSRRNNEMPTLSPPVVLPSMATPQDQTYVYPGLPSTSGYFAPMHHHQYSKRPTPTMTSSSTNPTLDAPPPPPPPPPPSAAPSAAVGRTVPSFPPPPLVDAASRGGGLLPPPNAIGQPQPPPPPPPPSFFPPNSVDARISMILDERFQTLPPIMQSQTQMSSRWQSPPSPKRGRLNIPLPPPPTNHNQPMATKDGCSPPFVTPPPPSAFVNAKPQPPQPLIEPSPPLVEEYVWRGVLEMPGYFSFNAAFVGVSGPTELLSRDLPNHLKIVGRIGCETVYDYVRSLKGNLTKDVLIIRIAEPTDLEQKAQYEGLFANMMQKAKLSVVDTNKLPKVKDLYLIPLGEREQPNHALLPFDGAGLPVPRSNLILVVIVRRKDQPESSSSHSQIIMDNSNKQQPLSTHMWY